MKKLIKVENRKSTFVELKDYCVMSMGSDRKDKGDFMEVTQWSNWEGYDVYISAHDGIRQLHFTYGEFKAIKDCIKAIHKSDYKK
jgi:hypothetical protein